MGVGPHHAHAQRRRQGRFRRGSCLLYKPRGIFFGNHCVFSPQVTVIDLAATFCVISMHLVVSYVHEHFVQTFGTLSTYGVSVYENDGQGLL